MALRQTPVFLLCVSLVVSAGADELRYTVTDLGPVSPPGYVFSLPEGLNGSGQVLMSAYWAHPPASVPLLHDGLAVRRVFGDLSVSAHARAINDAGQVVGRLDNNRQAYVWTAGDVRLLPHLPGGMESWALSINNRGQAVGHSEFGGSPAHAVLWEPDGTVVDLGAPTGGSSQAFSINERGEVVGRSLGASTRPMLWREGQAIELPLPLGARHAYARDLNDHGDIVGMTNSLGIRALHWTSLEVHVLSTPTGFASAATAVNNGGDVVGNMISTEDELGVLWRDGVAYALDDLLMAAPGWRITLPRDINEHGWILAEARFNGVPHTALLKPVPEPGSLVLLSGLAMLRRRRTVK